MLQRVRALLESPRAPLWASLLALLVCLPSLALGEYLDDAGMRAASARGETAWDHFNFATAEQTAYYREHGRYGWWAQDDFAIRFMRPLSSLTHHLDYTLWPDAVWLMHLESALLYALLTYLAVALIQRMHGPGLAIGIAGLVFALDEVHMSSVYWLSGRNTLLSAVFGVLTLHAHLRWRRPEPGDRGPAIMWAVLGPLSLLASLLSAEAGLCTFGYIVAWALCCERGSVLRRSLPVLPYLALIVAWRAIYVELGYGVVGSSVYLDLGEFPLEFLRRALTFAPGTAFTQLGLPLTDMIMVAPISAALFSLVFVALVWALLPILRADSDAAEPGPRGLAWFWLLGMVFAAIPFAATYPQSRLLFVLGVGGSALVGLAFADWRARRRSGARHGLMRRVLIGFVLVCNLLLAPLAITPFAMLPTVVGAPTQILDERLPESGELVALVNVPAEGNPLFVFERRFNAGRGMPDSLYLLFAGSQTVTVTRRDAETLVLESEAGWAASPIDRFLRNWQHGFAVGEQVTLDHAKVTVLEVSDDARPLEVEVRFDRSIDTFELWGFGRDGAAKDELTRWQPGIGETAVFTTSL